MLKIVKPPSHRKYAPQHHHYAVCRLESSRNVGKLRSRPASFRVPSLCAVTSRLLLAWPGCVDGLKFIPAFHPFPLPERVIWAQSTDCPKLYSINDHLNPGNKQATNHDSLPGTWSPILKPRDGSWPWASLQAHFLKPESPRTCIR